MTPRPAPPRPTRWGLVAQVIGAALASLVVGKMVAGGSPLAVAISFVLVLFAMVTAGPFGLMLGFIAVLFTRPGDLFPSLEEIGIAKVFAGSAILLLVGQKLFRRDTSVARSHYDVWMIGLTVAVFLSVLRSTDKTGSAMFFANVFVKIVLLWALMFETISSRTRTVAFQVVIASVTSMIAAYSIVMKFTGANLVEGSRSAFVGMLADPNDVALTLLMAVPFLIEAVLARGVRATRLLWIALLLLNVAGIVATQSRGGFLGLGAAGCVILRTRVKSTVLVGGLLVVGLLGAVALSGVAARQTVVSHEGGIDASAQGRLDAWYAGARMLAYNPINGVGLNQVTENYSYYAVNPVEWRPKTSHNAFVQAAAETGFSGIIPLLGLVFLAFWSAWRLRWEIPDDATPLQRALLRSQLATLAGVMVAAFFLSVAWSWFFYIVIAQAGTSHRVWITSRALEPRPEPVAAPC